MSPRRDRVFLDFLLRPRWLTPARSRTVQAVVATLCRIPRVRLAASRALINYYAEATPPRPHPYSMASDYTSWISLTDRTFSGRHLAPCPDKRIEPSEAEINTLFERREFLPSTDTSVAFMFFAQWFTDSFLRTDPADPRKNKSNHGIDMCQIYGIDQTKTELLRADSGGRLKSRMIGREEYPMPLYKPREKGEPLVVADEFKGLHNPDIIDYLLRTCPEDRKDDVFAVGLEQGNSTVGHVMFNVLFLREHNRIARELERAYPTWNNDRLFETTRNIVIVLMLKLVIEEYIMHIGPFEFPITAPEFIADGASWNRTNWISIEFNLLYRWHSLAPDVLETAEGTIQSTDFINNNALVMRRGIAGLMADCSKQRAGRIGLRNTPSYLVRRELPDRPSAIEKGTTAMRGARLPSYNDYREHFSLPRFTSYAELTRDVDLQRDLERIYGDIDNLEWLIGIFAEDYPPDNTMGQLMATMVGYDAFTQALTNPLLSKNVYNEQTFSPVGWKILNETKMRPGRGILQQVIERNSVRDKPFASFRC